MLADAPIVLMSMTRRPCASDAQTPSSPSSDCRTCCESGSIVITASAPIAASAADVATRHVPARNASSARADASYTATAWPPRARLRAIGAPITPTPMKPTFIPAFAARRRWKSSDPSRNSHALPDTRLAVAPAAMMERLNAVRDLQRPRDVQSELVRFGDDVEAAVLERARRASHRRALHDQDRPPRREPQQAADALGDRACADADVGLDHLLADDVAQQLIDRVRLHVLARNAR